jgi:hypothetical protein
MFLILEFSLCYLLKAATDTLTTTKRGKQEGGGLHNYQMAATATVMMTRQSTG